jgi:hypothetical protein
MSMQQRLVALACVGLAPFFAPGLFAAPRNLSVEETVNAQRDLLFTECKPTDEQQKTLKEKLKAKQDAWEAWDKANAEKMTAAQTAAAAARKGADTDAKKKTNEDLKALQAEREQAAAEADKAILAVLTDDQKRRWAGAQLAQTTLAKYKKSNLTDDQIAKIKSACVIAANDLSAFTGDDKKDKQGRTTVEKSLKWAIDNVILTPDQRGEPRKPAGTPAAPAPAAPAPAADAPPAPDAKAPEAAK